MERENFHAASRHDGGPSRRADHLDAITYRTLAELRQRVRSLGCQAASYCFGFSAVGFNSDVLAVAALGFKAAAAMTAFGRQKSAATLTISSAGLLSSGEKRLSADSVLSTESALTWRNFLKPSSPRISRSVGFLSKPPRELRSEVM